MKAPRKTPSALLIALLRDAAPAAAPFVPRRAYWSALADVQRSICKVHDVRVFELRDMVTIPLPDEYTGVEVMRWVRDNQDSIYMNAGCC